jgi:NAD(P)H-hydrate epimerase
MTTPDRPLRSAAGHVPLPADDPTLFELDLDGLAERWADAMARAPMTAEEMTGADARARRFGVPGIRLMEQAGCAVGAVARALAVSAGRWESGPILVLCGSGNNGGDGFVAARRLAAHGARVAVALVATGTRPGTPDAARNWDRLGRLSGVERVHAPVARDVALLGHGVERAAIVIDALLGTGVRLLRRAGPIGRRLPTVPARLASDPRDRLPDGRRPHVGRALRPGRPGRRHGDIPPAEGRPPDPTGRGGRRPRPRRPDRHPSGGRPCLTHGPAGAPPAGGRCC